MTLGVAVAAEVLGNLVLGQGLSSQLRPKRYFTVSKSTLDSVIGDVHELINFFVIEFQRILFAENVFVTVAVSFNPSTTQNVLTVIRPSSVPSPLTT